MAAASSGWRGQGTGRRVGDSNKLAHPKRFPDKSCPNCGSKNVRASRRYCSWTCYKSHSHADSYEIPRYHRARTTWTQSVWYGHADMFSGVDCQQKGAAYEKLAHELLRKLGATDIIHLSMVVPQSPFDFVCTLRGRRCAIDATTKWQKRVSSKVFLANALGVELYLLMISPRDRDFYHFTAVSTESRSVRVPVSLIRSIATKHSDPDISSIQTRPSCGLIEVANV